MIATAEVPELYLGGSPLTKRPSLGWMHELAKPGSGLPLKPGWKPPYGAERGAVTEERGTDAEQEKEQHTPIQETTENV